MQQIPLSAIANQKLSITLSNVRYVITIKEASEIMVIDINRESVDILRGGQCLPNVPVIPYLSIENNQGNFIFLTKDDNLPYWSSFGTTDFLYYLTNDEMQAMRNG